MTTDTQFGAVPVPSGVRFAVWSGAAEKIWLCLFDDRGEREVARHDMQRAADGTFSLLVSGLKAGQRYGYRADGRYDPDAGLWFDPDKLLVDPYAIEIDRPYRYDATLAAPRGEGGDTAPLMPKAIVVAPRPVKTAQPLFRPGGLIYELQVRSFTKNHPDVPEGQRGTIAALAHPAVVAHLKRIGVSAIELMPVTAWIDERHLPPLGLHNAWGYNPVTFMALDPRLAPGGLGELRDTVAALRRAGIGTILDLVFNHTGESDRLGPTLSLRGLDANAYYRHARGRLVNDTGTGNTVACDHPVVERLVLDTLRHFVRHAGVDGFRFDLAPILGRDDAGFDADAPLLAAIRTDPMLAGRVMIAEPWDIGADGYQLGNFRPPMLEWNDRYRDDVRRFWRGDRSTVGALATRLAGSSDIFRRDGAVATRSVDFIAAHDGFTLADLVSFAHRHNEANGEGNRDGHGENFSWNGGVEGETSDPKIIAARKRDVDALLATLFASRGTIMLTAGDEFGRTQGGNNNAYAQDNAVTWLDWRGRNREREAYVAALAHLRRRFSGHFSSSFLSGDETADGIRDVAWLTEAGKPMETPDWEDPERHRLVMMLGVGSRKADGLAVAVNGDRRGAIFRLPAITGRDWEVLLAPPDHPARQVDGDAFLVAGRTVVFLGERRIGRKKGTKA
ncbi:MAG: glycogen debranching protein GlgX [Rhizobiales bacterium]|nr:glycogen debranching protein GlgX [Hyphomicrobiales bacterium]